MSSYVCISHPDRPAWVNVERQWVKGDICYDCYLDVLKRDKEERKPDVPAGVDQ